MWNQLKAGDIGLGDRAYGDYVTLASLPRQGVDVVARLHQKRKVDFRRAKRLAKHDGLFLWIKGWQQSNILSAREWAQLPGQITVRLLRFTVTIRGHRARRITLVTTLLDPKLYPAQELMALYCRRWRLELCLRDLKTTMGLEQLRCQSPEMAQKELLAYLVAHNLMRCANTATPSGRRATRSCAANYGRIYCSTWRVIWCVAGRTARNHARSNTGPNPIRCSTNRAIALWKSPTAATTGKAALAIIEGLTKGHSGQFLILTYPTATMIWPPTSILPIHPWWAKLPSNPTA